MTQRPIRPALILSASDMGMEPQSGMLNVTQHWFDHDMDQWGKSRGDEVHESGNRMSRLLGPDGSPMIYPKARLGFDLTPRNRR